MTYCFISKSHSIHLSKFFKIAVVKAKTTKLKSFIIQNFDIRKTGGIGVFLEVPSLQHLFLLMPYYNAYLGNKRTIPICFQDPSRQP